MFKIIISTVVLSTINFSASATQEINIDMAKDTKVYNSLLTEDEFKLIVRNIPPLTRDLYLINLGFKVSTAPPLKKPKVTKALGGNSSTHICQGKTTEDQKLQVDIYAATDPKIIASLYHTARTGTDRNKYSPQCLKQINEDVTYISPTTVVPHGYDSKISIEYGGAVLKQYNLTKETTTWLTHVGFTFTHNSGTSYYSKGTTVGEVTNYAIHEQNNQQDYLYSATALFTYQVGSLFGANSAKWGWTAGLGASSDSISVLFGPSIIIKDNVLINFGISYQEFEELKGIYFEGMPLGTKPVDSSALTSKSFKPSFAITIGFRFGE